MNIKKMKFFIAMPMFLIGFVLMLHFNTQTANAGLVIDGLAKNAAPQGLSLNNDGSNYSYFTKVDPLTITSDKVQVNSAQIAVGPNSKFPDSDVAIITNSTQQIGSIWSDTDKDNYFDTSKPQKLSMWFYFGNALTPGDGMAFVLQNGDASAISKDPLTGNASGGQTLGVWASDSDANQGDKAQLAKSAIQNSWALEFDTYLNQVIRPGDGNYFDADLTKYSDTSEHIASGYPGDPDTYNRIGSAGKYTYSMNHTNLHNHLKLTGYDSPTKGWFHVTIDYQPPVSDGDDAMLTYHFKDKNYDGTPNTTGEITQTEPIDLSKFNFKTDPKTGVKETKLRYGFTGSTGTSASANMAVFESMPSLVDANADSKIYDLTQNSNLVDSDYATVHDKDDMRFDYNLNYESGKKSLDNVVANIKLPDNITYATDGNIGKVIYADGSSEPIPVNGNVTDGTLNYQLKKSLSNDLNSAKIQIFGTATAKTTNGVPVPTVVDSAHAILAGDLYKTDLDTDSFVINPITNTLKLDATNTSTDQYQGTDVKLTGKATYGNDGSPASNLTYYTTIDDGSVIKSGYTGSTDGSYSLTLPYDTYKDELGVGPHKIKVYAMDKDYIKSDPVTYTVNVLETNPKLSSSNLDLTVPKATGEINMPASLTYDGTYKFDGDNLKWNISVGTGDVKTFDVNSKDTGVTNTDFTQVINASDLGITDSGTYKLNVYVSDQYGRKSNKITYKLNYIAKSVNLIKDDYSFQDVNSSPEAKTVKRKGDWKLAVKTTDSDWKLTAKASQMFMTNDKGEYVDALNGNLVYVDPDGNTQDMSDFVNLGENKNETSDTYDVTKDWKDNSGILLSMMPNPKQGSYKGTIDWVLQNSLS
ncbi:L-type lectin family protein [Companilactobacillus hulinensis]|uniref:hypothetical protein n=1 Tax=Companilactobacillus hulinensis TaxID=2486007 RepID=UPI000F7A69C2|nr:hypothetical protein [Companilactobacillus hulinensis]